MGQRSQIIIKYVTDKKEVEYLAFHNQWQYGFFMWNYAMDLLKTLNRGLCHDADYKKEHTFDYRTKRELILQSIKCVNHKDINNIKITHDCFDLDKTNNSLINLDSLEELYNQFDNNNGFLLLEIDSETNDLRIQFLSGREDADEIAEVTPKEYINLFYKDEDIEKMTKESKEEAKYKFELDFLTSKSTMAIRDFFPNLLVVEE